GCCPMSSSLEYTCPMHPEIVRPSPGSCPICGMALEPRTVTAVEGENAELVDMTRRFWVAVVFSTPVFLLRMSDLLPGEPLPHWPSGRTWALLELGLSAPVVLWAGLPFFVRGWQSIRRRRPNMFTLIALGVGAAFLYSVVAALAPGVFPAVFLGHGDA